MIKVLLITILTGINVQCLNTNTTVMHHTFLIGVNVIWNTNTQAKEIPPQLTTVTQTQLKVKSCESILWRNQRKPSFPLGCPITQTQRNAIMYSNKHAYKCYQSLKTSGTNTINFAQPLSVFVAARVHILSL